MKIAVASDHAGYPLKDMVVDLVGGIGHKVLDLGPTKSILSTITPITPATWVRRSSTATPSAV